MTKQLNRDAIEDKITANNERDLVCSISVECFYLYTFICVNK